MYVRKRASLTSEIIVAEEKKFPPKTLLTLGVMTSALSSSGRSSNMSPLSSPDMSGSPISGTIKNGLSVSAGVPSSTAGIMTLPKSVFVVVVCGVTTTTAK